MKKTINYKKVFSDYISNVNESKPQQLVKCIFHNDKNPSLSINTEKGIFNCHACDSKGNYWDFLKLVEPETDIKTLIERYYE